MRMLEDESFEADKVLGLLYLGYADNAQAPGQRIKPLEQKVRWVQ